MQFEPFVPIVANPHLLTILGNFWPRKLDFSPFAYEERLFRTEEEVQVLVQTHTPPNAKGELVMVHGLEGGGDSGYMRTLAHAAASAGFVAHRFHMRTCGGTAHLCKTLYHAGLTSDLLTFLRSLPANSSKLPVFLTGFSLGGNVALKLAGELGAGAREVLAGVCSVSAPIDLAASARRLGQRDNRIYQDRFVKRMRTRLVETGRYSREQLRTSRSIYEIDDNVTAPSFGFGTADNYYATQSANQFLEAIRIPALLIQAEDDTFIPFSSYDHPAFAKNKFLHLLATKHGGHMGFLARGASRFWIDQTVIGWIRNLLEPA